MSKIVLRLRLVSGERMDVTYEDPDAENEDEVIEHVISTLPQGTGALRSRHGDRLMVVCGRCVAAVEVAPRGSVLSGRAGPPAVDPNRQWRLAGQVVSPPQPYGLGAVRLWPVKPV